MAPLLISGIASIASSAIDAWSNAANRRVAVQQAKFDNAINRALGFSQPGFQSQAQPVQGAQTLENQLRNAPEIRGILDAQDPTRPGSLQVSGDGRVWLKVAGNAPTELTISQETRELARQLSASLNVAAASRSFSTVQNSAGTFAAFAR
jgi:lipopolysaccharide biosynthesis protein